MSLFDLPRESVTEILDYDVLVSENENAVEQRRLRNAEINIRFRITTPDLTQPKAKEYRDHFVSKYGALTSFEFPNPIDGTTYLVRYVEGSFNIRHAGGYFKCNFELKKVKL